MALFNLNLTRICLNHDFSSATNSAIKCKRKNLVNLLNMFKVKKEENTTTSTAI